MNGVTTFFHKNIVIYPRYLYHIKYEVILEVHL